MKVRAIDEGHDWKFGFNQSDYKEFSEAVKQNVLTAILTVRGDWFLALEVGIDWVNYLGRSSNLQLLEADLKSSVLNVDGVLRIDNSGAYSSALSLGSLPLRLDGPPELDGVIPHGGLGVKLPF